jgi:spore germination protein GerM
VTRRFLVPSVVLLAALLSACGRGNDAAHEPVPATPPVAVAAEPPQRAAAPIEKAGVTLYFPSAESDTLATESREIVDTKRPADRGAQILAALLEGPKTEGALPAFPPDTTLRQLWVRDDGNAYADFSEPFMAAASGGSADEILTVYAIVDSLTQNVPEIQRVGILVSGRERQTFGHLDLSRPLPPDLTLAASPKATE